jgi:DNA-binding CsgD family transcriptional regulator
LAELVEAAVYARDRARASWAMEHLAALTQSSGTDWALGVEASRRALLDQGASAAALHEEAIERLRATTVRLELARAQLLYGEFLRRSARRIDARAQLRAAHDAFTEMGADAFAARAGRELLATGETARKRRVDTVEQLTPQEIAIADLAAQGQTNAEIGAALYISPRTVEWHLRKVYAKLHVATRRELRAVRRADVRGST